jgi:hypothetical protein
MSLAFSFRHGRCPPRLLSKITRTMVRTTHRVALFFVLPQRHDRHHRKTCRQRYLLTQIERLATFPHNERRSLTKKPQGRGSADRNPEIGSAVKEIGRIFVMVQPPEVLRNFQSLVQGAHPCSDDLHCRCSSCEETRERILVSCSRYEGAACCYNGRPSEPGAVSGTSR